MPKLLDSTRAKSTIVIDGDEEIRVVDDPNGTPVSGKVTIGALKNYFSTQVDGTYLTEAEAAATYQPLDADLTTLGAGGSGARAFLGLGTMALEAAADYSTTAEIAAAYQPLDAQLTSLSSASANGVSLVKNQVTGNLCSGTVSATGTTLVITKYDGTYPGADGYVIVMHGSYEV